MCSGFDSLHQFHFSTIQSEQFTAAIVVSRRCFIQIIIIQQSFLVRFDDIDFGFFQD